MRHISLDLLAIAVSCGCQGLTIALLALSASSTALLASTVITSASAIGVAYSARFDA
jgi:hypothetical protein